MNNRSRTAWAAPANAASALPTVIGTRAAILELLPAWATGLPGIIAAAQSDTAGSGSQSTTTGAAGTSPTWGALGPAVATRSPALTDFPRGSGQRQCRLLIARGREESRQAVRF